MILRAGKDHETALSAVRNLNNTDVGGRPLRIDLADSDPFLEGKTTVRGEIIDGGAPGPTEPRSQWRSGGHSGHRDGPGGDSAFLANLPPGIQIPQSASALDYISQTLASMPPHQLMEVLAQMKVKSLSRANIERECNLMNMMTLGICDYPPRASQDSPSCASSTCICSFPSTSAQ
jgi:hypothetical protein